jgi:hypothetical protein
MRGRIGACGVCFKRRLKRAESATEARASHEDLIEQQINVSRKRVVRLMQEGGLVARSRKRFK